MEGDFGFTKEANMEVPKTCIPSFDDQEQPKLVCEKTKTTHYPYRKEP